MRASVRARELAVPLLSLAAACDGAVVLNQLETWDSASHGWTDGPAVSTNPPVVFPDFGPGGPGDSALKVTSRGGSGAGSKLVTINTTLWTGNFSGRGIDVITVDFRNQGTVPLAMRLAFEGPGGWWITAARSVPTSVGWVASVFDIRPDSLLAGENATDAGASMSAVTQMRILHSNTVHHKGASVSASVLVDNLHAVPEPSHAAWAGLSLLAMNRRRTR